MTAQAQAIEGTGTAALKGPLVRVRIGTAFFLHYPEKVYREGPPDKRGKPTRTVLYDFGTETGRGGAGYVVDWTSALEREWCAGQEHKLEDVPSSELSRTAPTPHRHPQALRAFAAIEAEKDRAKVAAEQEKTAKAAYGPKPRQTFKEIEA